MSLSWSVAADGTTSVNVTVPPNVKSQVLFPAHHAITERGRAVAVGAAPDSEQPSAQHGAVGVAGVTFVDRLGRATVVYTGSGSYKFVSS